MNTITLLGSHYTPEDAKDLLMSTINANINFYNIKNLSAQIRYGQPDVHVEEKLEALNKARKQLQSILEQARSSNSLLRIESVIRISIENEEVEQPQKVCLQAETY